MVTKDFVDNLSYEIFASIIEVHKNLGPGLIESIYHKCLAHELKLRNINFTSEASFEFNYKELNLSTEVKNKILGTVKEKLSFNPNVDHIYISPRPQDYEMFFADHFSLNSALLERIVRIGFKSAISTLRSHDI